MPEPFPKLVVNHAGERKTVLTHEEQDEAARQGFYRSLGRVAERADVPDPPPNAAA